MTDTNTTTPVTILAAPITAERLAVALNAGGPHQDVTALVDDLSVRVWFDTAPDSSLCYGWRWEVAGAGPRVWYGGPEGCYQYLTRHWGAIRAEAVARHRVERDLPDRLEDHTERALREEVAKLQAENFRLQRTLRQAEDKLTSLRSAVAGVQNALGKALVGA
jgi:hypothetical protein